MKFLKLSADGTRFDEGTANRATLVLDGSDTVFYVTITDSLVTSSSRIVGNIVRNVADDTADPGYFYLANVIRVANGSFVLAVMAQDLSSNDPALDPPTETIYYDYLAE